MDYRIVAADAAIGQIQVTYSNNEVDIATYAVDVPVVDGAFITGNALAAEIQHRAPVWLIQRIADVSTATGFSDILSQVQEPVVLATESTTPAQTFVLNEIAV